MNPNESAFPSSFEDTDCGLTVRAYIATKAMAALLVNHTVQFSADQTAQDAVLFADALIAELSKTP